MQDVYDVGLSDPFRKLTYIGVIVSTLSLYPFCLSIARGSGKTLLK
jgi:hypothetical protein